MKRYLLPAAAVLCLLLAGCDRYVLQSSWRDQPVVIDGKDTEWQGRMLQIGNLYLGLCNDNDFLYLCLSATDTRTKAQMVGLFRQSFMVWFDPQGRRRRTFGLKLSNESPFMDETLVTKVRYIRNPQFQVIASEMMNNMEIEVLQDNYPSALLSEVKGIDVAVGTAMNGRKLTYEFRFPLKKSEQYPFAVEASTGSTICVGLETSRIDLDYVIERIDNSQNGTGHPRTGYRVVARRPEMNMDYDLIRYLDLWCRVKLAGEKRSPAGS